MTQYFIGIFLICIGFLVKRYPNLIAGYNTLPKEEKDKIDIDKLSGRMKVTFIAMGVLILILIPVLQQMRLSSHITTINIGVILVGTLSLFIHNNYR